MLRPGGSPGSFTAEAMSSSRAQKWTLGMLFGRIPSSGVRDISPTIPQ